MTHDQNDMYWGLLGTLPAPLSTQRMQTQAVPAELNQSDSAEKALRKWLKKNPDLPLLVLVLDGQNRDQQLALLHFLRRDLGNDQCRVICYADDDAHQILLQHLWSWRIHHLYRLEQYDPLLLDALIDAGQQQYLSERQKRVSRSHELELLTWLARMSRLGSLSDEALQELASLFALITSASLLLQFDGQRQLLSCYPGATNHLSNTLLAQAQGTVNPPAQAVSLQLDRNTTLHQLASEHCGEIITASIHIDLRCYDAITAGFVIFLNEQAVAQFDVAQMTLLEKAVEQTRTQLERQQSELRLKDQYERLRQTLEKLHQAQEQLYHADKLSAIGQLAAGIAHEINNPVAYVMSNFEPLDEYIQTMMNLLKLHDGFIRAMQIGDLQVGESIREAILKQQLSADFEFMMEDVFALVSDSRKGLQRVSEIVTNLRSLSRRDSMEMVPINLSDCIQSAVKIMNHQLKCGFTTELDIPPNAQVTGNEGMMVQVLINLIQNAIHAMGDSGTLGLTLTRHENNWQLVVADSGCGIPEAIRDKIFDPFFTTKEIGKGTGLGLSTVYSILQNHQGDIRVDSEPGKGTRFTLTLPALD